MDLRLELATWLAGVSDTHLFFSFSMVYSLLRPLRSSIDGWLRVGAGFGAAVSFSISDMETLISVRSRLTAAAFISEDVDDEEDDDDDDDDACVVDDDDVM